MKCPSCGAEIGDGKICQFCGAQISAEMLREKEVLNKAGCPKCGSTNVSFSRENQGEIRGKSGKKIVHYTVGVCKDCGYTWRADGEQGGNKRKTWLWVLGWLFIFPLPLTLILLKKKDMKPVLKYGIIAAAWILFLLIGIVGNNNKTAEATESEKTSLSAEENHSTEGSSKTEDILEITETEAGVSETKESTETEESIPIEYKNALKKAESYSKTMHMSKKGIFDQLTSEYGERFPEEAAQYAVDNLVADYKDNALKKAENYSNSMHMSKKGIYDQLVSEYGEQFTKEEAQYAVDTLVADYNENALAKARNYQTTMNMSKKAIYDQLISEYGEQFTKDEAQYAIDHLE